jgi:hypothetical protein
VLATSPPRIVTPAKWRWLIVVFVVLVLVDIMYGPRQLPPTHFDRLTATASTILILVVVVFILTNPIHLLPPIRTRTVLSVACTFPIVVVHTMIRTITMKGTVRGGVRHDDARTSDFLRVARKKAIRVAVGPIIVSLAFALTLARARSTLLRAKRRRKLHERTRRVPPAPAAHNHGRATGGSGAWAKS